jgi:hypothetical protein
MEAPRNMPGLLVQRIKLNNLQFNVNRDPQIYRRCVHQPFRIQAVLAGAGDARCALNDANGRPLAARTVALPGTFTHEIAFDTPGTRIVTLVIENAGTRVSHDLRLDVMEHAWVG